MRTVLKPSGKLEIIWKNPDRFESIGFSVINAKLSGRAKTFQVAMLPCHPDFSDSNLIRHRRMKHFGLEFRTFSSHLYELDMLQTSFFANQIETRQSQGGEGGD